MSAIALACGTAGIGMAALGWLDRDLDVVGRDLIGGLRGFLGVDATPVAAAPERPELYYSTGANPLPDATGLSWPTGSDEQRTLERHASRGAMIGRPTLVDGDTLRLGQRTVSLWGVDAPELGQPCIRSGRAWRCGHESARMLADYIASRPVACYDKGTDTEGRMLGQCFVGGSDLGGWMARNGWVFARRTVTWTYISDESIARGKRIGIWRASGLEAPWEWRRNN